MSLPAQIKKSVDKALEAVRSDPRHDLPLGYRQAIWAAMGERNTSGKVTDSQGHARRAKLAVLAARKTLPLLKRARMGIKTPQRLLDEAEKVIEGKSEGDKLKTDAAMYRVELDNRLGDAALQSPLYAGYSAVKAAFTAFEDEDFDADHIDYEETDASRDPFHLDSSYLSALAYANGASDEEDSDADKRLEFWEWWLTEAVENAL
jgi:hypothetical protein